MLRHFIPPWRFLASKAAIAGLAACLLVVAFAYAGVRSVTTRLNLAVGEQVYLAQQGNNLILKIRMAPGVTAQLWADNVCGQPKSNALVFTKSGNYTIPVESIKGSGASYACLLSSDGQLKTSVALAQSAPPGLSSASPNSGAQGQSLSVVLTGSNFVNQPTCSFGAGITVNSCTFNSATQLTASIVIAANAAVGARNISVTNPDGQSATLTNGFSVQPPLSALSLNPTTVVGGNPSQGTVTLTSVAPAGGTVVSLSSSNTSVATVPASATVPGGATIATFTVTTNPVTANTTVNISASEGGVTKSVSLAVNPASLTGLRLTPTTVVSGKSSQGTVTLDGPAPSGGAVVSLSSSNTSVATVPSSATVPAGATSATFTVTTKKVTSSTSVTISATYRSTTKTAMLSVTP